MIRFSLLIIFSLIVGCTGKQPTPVCLHYEYTESPATDLKIKLSGALQGKSYQIRMAPFKNGEVTYKILNEKPFIKSDTISFISITIEPLHAHEVRFKIEGEKQITEDAEVDDVLYSILMEVYPTQPYNSTDTIPLAGYTNGAPCEIMIDGELKPGGSYCDVRNAKLPPAEWSEAFDMKEYVWFDLYFE